MGVKLFYSLLIFLYLLLFLIDKSIFVLIIFLSLLRFIFECLGLVSYRQFIEWFKA
jgi:hypothetical protein